MAVAACSRGEPAAEGLPAGGGSCPCTVGCKERRGEKSPECPSAGMTRRQPPGGHWTGGRPAASPARLPGPHSCFLVWQLPRGSSVETDAAGSGAGSPGRCQASKPGRARARSRHGASRLPQAEVERRAAWRGARSRWALQPPPSGLLAGPRVEKPRPGTCEVLRGWR